MRAQTIFNDNLSWAAQSKSAQHFDYTRIVPISTFDGGAGTEWIKISGGTVSDDTTYVRRSNKSVRINSVNQGTWIEKTISATDFSAVTHFVYSVYIPDKTKLTQIYFRFSSDAGFASYFNKTLSISQVHDGWNEIVLPMYQSFTTTGTPSWTAIIKIRINLTCTGMTGDMYCDDMYAMNGAYPDKGIVCLTFDNAYSSVYTDARRIMDKYRMRGTLFVQPPEVGTAGHMTEAQLHEWEQSGGDLGGHSWTHADFTTLTEAQIRREVMRPLLWLAKKGFAPVDCMAYPYGAVNGPVMDVVSEYYSYARSTYVASVYGAPYPIVPRLAMNNVYITNASTLVSAQGYVDACEANKSLVMYTFHKVETPAVDANMWPVATFESFIDYLATKNVYVMPFSKILRKYP